jgi:hypothetical protein
LHGAAVLAIALRKGNPTENVSRPLVQIKASRNNRLLFATFSLRKLSGCGEVDVEFDKIQAKLRGNAEEKKRREQILAGILRSMEQGGSETVRADLESRLEAMKQELDEKLAALRKKL